MMSAVVKRNLEVLTKRPARDAGRLVRTSKATRSSYRAQRDLIRGKGKAVSQSRQQFE